MNIDKYDEKEKRLVEVENKLPNKLGKLIDMIDDITHDYNELSTGNYTEKYLKFTEESILKLKNIRLKVSKLKRKI